MDGVGWDMLNMDQVLERISFHFLDTNTIDFVILAVNTFEHD